MNRTKLDVVKDIYSTKNSMSEEAVKAQAAYTKRLQNDIERTRIFIQQADSGIGRLQVDIGGQKQDERKTLIAQFTVYDKLAYAPRRDDVIDFASASIVTKQLLNEQTEAVQDFKNMNRQSEEKLRKLRGVMADYKHLIEEIDTKQKSMDSIIDGINSKEPVNSIQQKLKEVDSKQEQTSKMEKLLSMYLERVVLKFLALSDWQNSSVSNETMVRDKLEACLNLVYLLIEKPGWVRIEGLVEPQIGFVGWLSMNNIIEEKKDGTGTYLKLLNFSQID